MRRTYRSCSCRTPETNQGRSKLVFYKTETANYVADKTKIVKWKLLKVLVINHAQ